MKDEMHDSTTVALATRQHRELAGRLEEARQRTLWLVSELTHEDLVRQHSPLMSPILWDIGHIGNFEEQWGIRRLNGAPAIDRAFDAMYDPMINPRSTRSALSYPTLDGQIEYLGRIRREALRLLGETDLGGIDPILEDGYLYNMLLQHEYQHDETILATLQLKLGEPYHPRMRRALPSGDPTIGGRIQVPAGECWIGTNDRSAAYDNERPRHRVHIDRFEIDVAPVSNRQFMEFVESGGYRDERLWHPAGLEFIRSEGIEAPKYWERDGDGRWWTRSMDYREEVHPNRPVVHLCWYEADAYCRWAGCRLPSELEWEKAASWDPATGEQRSYPWGDEEPTEDLANLDQLAFMAAEIGAYPRGVSALGCHQMIGDVWEWTASDFLGWPGFEAFPYDEYSKVFFGTDYKVLRGGSWATRPGAIRNTFRNWDYPIRRQIFAGFRTVG
jgi:iron(II)-dependent oxidoreductase